MSADINQPSAMIAAAAAPVRTKAGCNCQDRKKTRHRGGGGLFVLNATLTSLRSSMLDKIVDLTGLDHLTPWC
jgi:hypothetical protein